MKHLWTSLSAFMLVAVLAVGCCRESYKGGPGANKTGTGTTGTGTGTTGTGTGTTTTGEGRDHLTIKVPSGNTNVTQGEQQEVTITVNRNGNFDQEVSLKFDPPAGLKVDPATVTVPKGKDDARVTVHANPDAKVGTTNVQVTGTGGGGPAAKVELGIEVKKKD